MKESNEFLNIEGLKKVFAIGETILDNSASDLNVNKHIMEFFGLMSKKFLEADY